MENTSEEPTVSKAKKSPPLALTIACIFSFIYNGILLLLSIIVLIYADQAKEILRNLFGNQPISDLSLYLIPSLATLMFIMAIYGVAQMWKLKRRGFVIYLISKIIIIFLLIFYNYLNYFNLGLSLFMIIFYWSYQRKFSEFAR